MAYAVIDRKERVFRNKKSAKAYYIKSDKRYHYYNISFSLDMSVVMSLGLHGIAAYATNSSSEDGFKETADIFSSINTSNPLLSVAGVLNYEKTDLLNYILLENKSDRVLLQFIDPTMNLNRSRYKENRTGTNSDKFGIETHKVSEMQKIKSLSAINSMINESDRQPSRIGNFSKSIRKRAVTDALLGGKGLIELLEYDLMTSKSRVDSHVITEKESERKERIKAAGTTLFTNPMGQFTGQLNNNGYREVVKIRKKDRKIMNLNFSLKISKKSLAKFEIDRSKFYLAFGAVDRTGVTTLDTLIIPINLAKDIKYSNVSLSGVSFGYSSTSRGEMSFLLSNNEKKSARFDMYYKNIRPAVPLLAGKFRTMGMISLSPKRSKHELILTKRNKESVSVNSTSYVPDVLATSHIIRATPTISGVALDNCYEAGAPSKSTIKNNTVPFIVKCSGVGYNKIIVEPNEIDPFIYKVRPVKRNITKYPYGSSSKFKPVNNEAGRRVGYTKIQGSTAKLTFRDYDVEDGDSYEYRLEIVRKLRNVKKEYSSNSFTDMYEKADDSVSLVVNDDYAAGGSSVSITVEATVRSNDITKLIPGLSSDTTRYSLFADSLKEIKDSTDPAVILKVERIDHSTGELKFLDYLQGASPGINITSFNLTDTLPFDNDSAEKGGVYTYKFTACSAPVAEIISSAAQEVKRRQGYESGRKLNFYGFSSLKTNLEKADLTIVSEIANKYSRSFKRKLIVDIDTQMTKNNGNILAGSSTGDTTYLTVDTRVKRPTRPGAPEGTIKFRKPVISYYPMIKNKKITSNKFNNSRMSHKFIIDIDSIFRQDIDHAAIFSFRGNKLSYECVIHTQTDKDSYRALIEMERVKGTTIFYLFPVTQLGKILRPILLGKYSRR
jgi:hypothetical protein